MEPWWTYKFLLVSVLVFNVIAYIIPKRISEYEMYSTSIFALVLQGFADYTFDLKRDLYGYFNVGPDFESFIPIIGLYPAFNIIFLNYYPYTQPFFKKCLYNFVWTLFSIAFEWASIQSGYFYHHDWKLWYSALCYPPIFFILAWNLGFLRRLK